MLGTFSLRGGFGGGLILGALIFFPWNAIEPIHGRLIVLQILVSLLAGQVLGVGLAWLYQRLFDVPDT